MTMPQASSGRQKLYGLLDPPDRTVFCRLGVPQNVAEIALPSRRCWRYASSFRSSSHQVTCGWTEFT